MDLEQFFLDFFHQRLVVVLLRRDLVPGLAHLVEIYVSPREPVLVINVALQTDGRLGVRVRLQKFGIGSYALLQPVLLPQQSFHFRRLYCDHLVCDCLFFIYEVLLMLNK